MTREGKSAPGAVGKLLILLVRLYQVSLSSYLSGHCRFWPTCSEYFIQAVQAKGALLGAWMGIRRILRCRPLGGRGYDPVE